MARSLISRLFRVRPGEGRLSLEDFFTEAFCHVLSQDTNLLRAFCGEFAELRLDEDVEIELTTQDHHAKRPEEDKSSRPDAVIRSCDGRMEIWLESKIGSREGDNQLDRYLAVLDTKGDILTKLIFLTRDYEPKDIQDARFTQRRWYEVFQFLSAWEPTNAWVSDVMDFMKEHGMSTNPSFTPAGIAHFQNIVEVFQTMDEILNLVTPAFKDLFPGEKKVTTDNKLNMLMGPNRRYTIYWAGDWWDVNLGFRSDTKADQTPDEYFSLYMSVSANLKKNPEIAEALKAQAVEGWNLQVRHGWVERDRAKSIREVLSSDTHRDACVEWFKEGIVQIASMKHPRFPWAIQSGEAASEGLETVIK